MIVEIKVPDLGESINKVEIGEWMVAVGESVRPNDPLVAIESEKATLELPAPEGGTLVEIVKQTGETADIGELIGRLDTETAGKNAGEKEPAPVAEKQAEVSEKKVMPSAARVMAENELAAEQVTATGPGERILKEDALRAAGEKSKAAAQAPEPATKPAEPAAGRQSVSRSAGAGELTREERHVPMTLLRRTLAARLLEAKQSMAMLTTFNEADMSEVKNMRSQLGGEFADRHEVRLGFMSFFVKAVVAGLKEFPLVNAKLDGDSIVYQNYCDIGVAIGGGKGLVVPVIRNAELLSFAEIEKQILDFGRKAKDNTLSLDELKGGTFTISNGGVYGSMLSTPIVNPPQSAILGLHAIKDRPVAVNGEVKIRPVMYLALSYDHRIIDGREAVSFLKGVKERIEQPHKLLLEI